MLHTQGRKYSQKSFHSLTLAVLVTLLALVGCEERGVNPNKDITLEAFSDLRTSSFSLNSFKIREQIEALCYQDNDSTTADYRTRSYYLDRKPFIWIDRLGVDSRADTLLNYLRGVEDFGFSQQAFGVRKLAADLQRVRNLDFDDSVNTINRVVARLEYRLTKAYLRYVIGQRYGYVNPLFLFNRLDALNTDSTGRALSYRRLFDIDVKRPDKTFMSLAFSYASGDSLGRFLRQSAPDNPRYYQLKERLKQSKNKRERMLILCNMERFRWREKQRYDTASRKYVIVNLPAYHLYAYGGDSIVDMRIGCGSLKTKTPLLTSLFYRMDVNPVWNIPMSIVKKDIVRHAGNVEYFARHRYYVAERRTGKRVETGMVTPAMLLSGAYRVAQEGGQGNALGRIIFRFPNKFSVYLHDTSSRGVFSRDDRGVSHGCVRVERPFDFATFLLDSPDEWLLDKLRITMGMEPVTERGKAYLENAPDNPRLVGSLKVSPSIPLYIVYYTFYPDETGRWKVWPDVYGYDKLMERGIKPFME